jgi:hypothetical protein
MANTYSRQYISVDGEAAIFGNPQQGFTVFELGETVGHQDESAGVATIQGFSVDKERGDVIVQTSNGWASLPFLEKV